MFQILVIAAALVPQIEDAPVEAPRPYHTEVPMVLGWDLITGDNPPNAPSEGSWNLHMGEVASDANQDHFGSAHDPIEAPEPMWLWMEKWERARSQRKLLEIDPEVSEPRRDLDTRVDASTDWESVPNLLSDNERILLLLRILIAQREELKELQTKQEQLEENVALLEEKLANAQPFSPRTIAFVAASAASVGYFISLFLTWLYSWALKGSENSEETFRL